MAHEFDTVSDTVFLPIPVGPALESNSSDPPSDIHHHAHGGEQLGKTGSPN
jgi:hypothetical protein